MARWPGSEVTQRGVDALVGDGLAAVDTAGVDTEEDFDAVSGAVGHFGGGDAGVEPEGDGGMPECVGPVREW